MQMHHAKMPPLTMHKHRKELNAAELLKDVLKQKIGHVKEAAHMQLKLRQPLYFHIPPVPWEESAPSFCTIQQRLERENNGTSDLDVSSIQLCAFDMTMQEMRNNGFRV